MLLALEWLKHALGCADEQRGDRCRTDVAVLYACGVREYQADTSPTPVVLPTPLAEFRRRIDEALVDERLAIPAAAARAEGLVSPAPLVVAPLPSAQGRQRVTDATTRDKAPKKSSSSSSTAHREAPAGPQPARVQSSASNRTGHR